MQNSSVQTVMNLGIEKIALSVPSMVPRKGKYSLLYRLWQVLIVLSIMAYLLILTYLFMCGVRKGSPSLTNSVATSSASAEDFVTASAPAKDFHASWVLADDADASWAPVEDFHAS
jgi:hypothetical protein